MKAIPILFLLLLVSISTIAQSKKVVRMTTDYLEVAFWKTGDQLQPLTKWGDADTLTYKVSGEFAFMNEKSWKTFLSEMEALTRKKFVETSEETYKILIYFGSIAEYSMRNNLSIPVGATRKFSNWSSRTFKPNQELNTTSFCIVPSKVQNNNDGEYLLQKLFIKSLGVLGELTDEYSLFYSYYNENNQRPTRTDKRLIKLHYRDEIKVGMTKDEVQRILKTMDLEELAAEKL